MPIDDSPLASSEHRTSVTVTKTKKTASVSTVNTAHVTLFPRPLGHKIRSFALLFGLWFYYLLPVLIAEAFRPENFGDEPMICVAGALVSFSCAGLIFLTIRGMRRSSTWRTVSIAVLVVYCLGALLMIIFRGKQITWLLDHVDYMGGEDDSAYRSYLKCAYVGRLVAETIFLICGILIVLPDLGILNDWEVRR